jgi:hypothetical protein
VTVSAGLAGCVTAAAAESMLGAGVGFPAAAESLPRGEAPPSAVLSGVASAASTPMVKANAHSAAAALRAAPERQIEDTRERSPRSLTTRIVWNNEPYFRGRSPGSPGSAGLPISLARGQWLGLAEHSLCCDSQRQEYSGGSAPDLDGIPLAPRNEKEPALIYLFCPARSRRFRRRRIDSQLMLPKEGVWRLR